MGAEEIELPWFPALMYHRVVREAGGADPFGLQVTTRQLEAQLADLRARGFRGVVPGDALAAAEAGTPGLSRMVVLTFDDGYADFMTHALPLLQRYAFTATVMVVAGRIGGTSRWDTSGGPPAALMGATEIREAHRAGIAIASHSCTHPRLPRLDARALRAEVAGSKAALEDLLGAPVHFFAYPFGENDRATRDAVQAAGYEGAFGNRPSTHARYEMARIDAVRWRAPGAAWRLRTGGLHFRMVRARRAARRLLGGS